MHRSTLRLNIEDQRLWRGDAPVQISNKAFQLLKLFAENANRLLTKEQILESVWGEIWVSEGLVKDYVRDLRVALGDDAQNPRFIETVRGRGYRFLGGVEIEVGLREERAPARPQTPTLMVGQLSDLSGSEQSARLCRGLTDDLITDLARFPDLMVLADARTSGDAPIGQDFLPRRNTQSPTIYALTGGVQVVNPNARVNVRLIEASGGRVIWSDQYNRKLDDVLEVQSDIVARVTSAVGGFSGQIANAERSHLSRYLPSNLEAYDLYLLAHELEAHFDREKTLRAIDLVKRAIELEPEFARAWLVLGWLSWQVSVGSWEKDVSHYHQSGLAAYVKAFELDPLDPFALLELASVRAIRGDKNGAKDAIERSLDLGRNQADLLIAASNYVAIVLGDPDRAKHLMNRGFEMLLRLPDWHFFTGLRVSYFCGDYERALELADKAPSFLVTDLFEVLSLAQLGRLDELAIRRTAFQESHPDFDHHRLAEILPITASVPMALYIEGMTKAGLCDAAPRLQVIR